MIVLDANILIRAVLGKCVRQLLEEYFPQGIRFYAPEAVYADAAEYPPSLLARQGKPGADVESALRYLLESVQPADREALRNDVIDALRRAAHSREETRSPLARDDRSEGELPGLDELPTPAKAIDSLLDEDRYKARLLDAFAEEPELSDVVRVVLDLGLFKPREIAAVLGIPVTEYQNRKKRLRRRLIEYRAPEVSET